MNEPPSLVCCAWAGGLLAGEAADPGVILWHGYALDPNYFSDENGVPEALSQFANRGIYSIRGTCLAFFSSYQKRDTSQLRAPASVQPNTGWEENKMRG